jgi:hypothetical protein
LKRRLAARSPGVAALPSDRGTSLRRGLNAGLLFLLLLLGLDELEDM